MKTTIRIFTILAAGTWMTAGCTKQPYYDIPTDANGRVVITQVAKAETNGVTTLDDQFTVVATLPNAVEGDVMTVELLKLQTPPKGGDDQLLPLSGTQKDAVVGSDHKASVTYTRAEAQLEQPGDYVTVTFSGKTDAVIKRVDLEQASTLSGPEYEGNDVTLTRGAGTAFFDVHVDPGQGPYTGQVVVKRKNGSNAPWETVGSFAAPAKVPVSGDDFAAGKDTMMYSFSATQGSYTDVVTTQIIVSAPTFFFKRTGMLSLKDASAGGLNLMNGSALPAGSPNAVLAVSGGSLLLKGGNAWATGGKGISFVPATLEQYNANDAALAMNLYAAGTPQNAADPASGEGVYVFQLRYGPGAADLVYGMLKATAVSPGASVDIEYRIGHTYAHLAMME